MTNATARVKFTLAVALLCASALQVRAANAQDIKGIVRSKTTGGVMQRVTVSAQSSDGNDLGSATTDDYGRFRLKLRSIAKPVVITLKRLGLRPSNTDPLSLAASDTSEFEFLVEEIATTTDTMRVVAKPELNERRLIEAERRGWKVFMPVEVARHRVNALTVNDLLRSWGYPGLIFPSNQRDCIRSTRNNKCLEIVVDGQMAGTTSGLNPRDIYFLAYVGATEAMFQWGDKTPNGAIAIYTRMNGDKIR